MQSCPQEIANLGDVLPTFDLIIPFNIDTDFLQVQSNFTNAARALNNHIKTRSEYATIDDYLNGEQIQVTPTWAEICENVGDPISEENIQN